VKATRSSSSALGASLIIALLTGSCSYVRRVIELDFVDLPDSRLQNLESLHTQTGKHRYSARFVGDFAHTMDRSGRSVLGLQIGDPNHAGFASGAPEAVPNPGEKCFELVDELLSFDPAKNERLAMVQISWCARLISQDPSDLVRERATLALGPLGRMVGIGPPAGLAIDEPRANAEETAVLLTAVVSAWRGARDGFSDVAKLEAACAAMSATTFDLEGARRVLLALAGLLQGKPQEVQGYEHLAALVQDFKRRGIELALNHALTRTSGIVRAAGVSASVEACGPDMFARFLNILQAEAERGLDRDPLVVRTFFDLVLARGLPSRPAELSASEYENLLGAWTALLVQFAVQDPESRLRVRAMRALAAVTDGPDSLREEDWEAWWYEHINVRRAEAGLPPSRDAVEPSGNAPPAEESTPEDVGAAPDATPDDDPLEGTEDSDG